MKSYLIIPLLLFNAVLFAQDQTANNSGFNNVITYFSGQWQGIGAFANGTPIEATLSFNKDLDSNWLISSHIDLAPNTFKAMGVWGMDQQGVFQAYIFDNYKGHRKLKSQGWVDDELVLINKQTGGNQEYFERFIYKKIDEKSFKMIYEVSQNNLKWKMIDFLIFKKV